MTAAPTTSDHTDSEAKSPTGLAPVPISRATGRHVRPYKVEMPRDFRVPRPTRDEPTRLVYFRLPESVHQALSSIVSKDYTPFKDLSEILRWCAGRGAEEYHEANRDGDPFIDDWIKTYDAEKAADFDRRADQRQQRTLDTAIDSLLRLLWAEDWEGVRRKLEFVWDKTTRLNEPSWRVANTKQFCRVQLFRHTARVLLDRGLSLSADMARALGV